VHLERDAGQGVPAESLHSLEVYSELLEN
jgi:hypothetical protein